MYNRNVDYINFPTQQFTICTDKHNDYNEALFSQFVQTKYIYSAADRDFCSIEKFNDNINKFDIIDPQYHKYYSIDNKLEHKNCNDKLVENAVKHDCSVVINDNSKYELLSGNISINNLVILCRLSERQRKYVKINANIRDNLEINNCKKLDFTQINFNRVKLHSWVTDCMFYHIKVLELSDTDFYSAEYRRLEGDYRRRFKDIYNCGIIAVNIDKLITKTQPVHRHRFRNVKCLEYLTPIQGSDDNPKYISPGYMWFSRLMKKYDIEVVSIKINGCLTISNNNSMKELYVSCDPDYNENDNKRDLNICELEDDPGYILREFNNVDKKYILLHEQELVLSNCSMLKTVVLDNRYRDIKIRIYNCKNLESIKKTCKT